MAEFDPTNTSVEEIHDKLCEGAATVANYLIANDQSIPSKWRGGEVVRNGSPYNEGKLVLEITEEYGSASERIKTKYRVHIREALKGAIVQQGELFVGMIFGEARAGRNYFERWQQTPTTIF